MLWFFLSLLTAFSVALRDVSIKVFNDLHPRQIGVLELLFALPFLAICFAFVPIPPLDNEFWWAFGISIPLNIIAYFVYLHALKFSPLSLTVPFLAFTPVFMILTGFLILGETVNSWGAAGVLLIVSGSYVLNISHLKEGLLKPFLSISQEKGSWMMLVLALIYAFAAVIGKKAMLHSSPLFFSYAFFCVFNIVILAALFSRKKTNTLQTLRHNYGKGLWLGLLLFFHITAHGIAISISTAVYMISVKRSSILISVFLSWIVLKEENIASRGIGSLLMFAGVVLITLFG